MSLAPAALTRLGGALIRLSLVFVLVMLAAACNDSDKPAATSTASAGTTPGTTPDATQAAGVTPAATSASGDCQPPPPSTDPNVVKPARLSTLCSYRYSISLIGQNGPMVRFKQFTQADGAQIAQIGQYVAPDRASNAINFGFLTSTSVVIGDQLWVKANTQIVGPSTVDAERAKSVNVPPTYWDTTGLLEDFGAFVCARNLETINGVPTRACAMDIQHYKENRLRFGGLLNDASIKDVLDFICEVALSQEGYPIRLRIGIAGTDTQDKEFRVSFQMDLLDLNSKDIKIEPPR